MNIDIDEKSPFESYVPDLDYDGQFI